MRIKEIGMSEELVAWSRWPADMSAEAYFTNAFV